MKIIRIASAAMIAALVLTGIAGCDRTSTEATSVPAVIPVQLDSVVAAGPGEISISAEFPVDTVSALSKAVGEYVSEALGGSWEGSCVNFHGMLEHYVSALSATYSDMFKDLPADQARCLDETSVVKLAENDKYVTYFVTHDLYLGGAHGSQMLDGVTFRKCDGRRIGWDVFTGQYDDNFAALVKNGLKEYWQISSDKELRSYFLDENDFYSVPLPECAPLFTEDGVRFVYNEYEIAAYASGRPAFTVPYSEIGDYMMVTARRLL